MGELFIQIVFSLSFAHTNHAGDSPGELLDFRRRHHYDLFLFQWFSLFITDDSQSPWTCTNNMLISRIIQKYTLVNIEKKRLSQKSTVCKHRRESYNVTKIWKRNIQEYLFGMRLLVKRCVVFSVRWKRLKMGKYEIDYF